MVVGDFNTNLVALEGRARDKEIAASILESGLDDMNIHFLPQHRLWLKDVRTWAMHRGGREVRSQTNYILGTYSRMLQNVAVWYVQHNTNHYLVMG